MCLEVFCIRWVSRVVGDPEIEPDQAEVASWPESMVVARMGDFQYIDQVVTDVDAALAGPVLSRGNRIPEAAREAFSITSICVMARLKVDEEAKYGLEDPRTVRPFYISVERDSSQTIIGVFQGDEDRWSLGAMLLQPPPRRWYVVATVAGIQVTVEQQAAYDIPNDAVALNLTSLVSQAGFLLHRVYFQAGNDILWDYRWDTGQELPAGQFGQTVLTQQGVSLTFDQRIRHQE